MIWFGQLREFLQAWWWTRQWRSFVWAIPAILLSGVVAGSLVVRPFINGTSQARRYRAALNDAVQKADPDEALLCFYKLRQLNAADDDLSYRFAQFALSQGRGEEALAELQRLAPNDKPGYAPAHLWFAQMLAAQKVKTPEMVAGIQQHTQFARQLEPDNETAQILGTALATAKAANPEWAEQLAIASGSDRSATDDRESDWAAAVAQLQGAAEVLRRTAIQSKVAASLPSSDVAIKSLAATGDQTAERPSVNSSNESASEPTSETIAAERAAAVAQIRKIVVEYGALERRLTLMDYGVLCEAQMLSGDLNGAHQTLQAGLKAFPNSQLLSPAEAKILLVKSEQAIAKNQIDLAYDYLEEALETGQSKNEALVVLTYLYTREQQPDRAWKLFRDQLDGSAIHPNILKQMANTMAARGALSDAKTLYEQILEATPEDADILNNLAWVLLESNEPDLKRALKLADKAVTQQPNNASYRDTRGKIYFEQERWDDAASDLKLAIQGGIDGLKRKEDAIQKTGNN